MMEVPKPEEKRKKVDDIEEGPKKSKKGEPKKEKFVDRIIRVLFGEGPTYDQYTFNVVTGLNRGF